MRSPIHGLISRLARLLGLRTPASAVTTQTAHSTEVDDLYALLYHLVHDPDESIDLSAVQTAAAFATQWRDLETGDYLLSDPWFRENVDRILTDEELQIRPDWLRGKRVLDAGCGSGRWAYGFAKLGASITCVDIGDEAIGKARQALREFDVEKEFFVCPLEELDRVLGDQEFDLVFSWGVLHHCRSFTRAFDQVVRRACPGGLAYLYLYGRESMPFEQDLELFKQRVHYNVLPTEEAKLGFLLEKTGGDHTTVHNQHDVYAPLINRRLEFGDVRGRLEAHGFQDVTRTIEHTELFVRAVRGDASEYRESVFTPRRDPPYWFQHHATQNEA